ncbi:MAG: hypothetical protein AAF828_11825 [Bacteroidota bacterium]
MAKLWLFYQQYPDYVGKAYYLREFEGILVKHLSSAEAVSKSERTFGVNVNLPFTHHCEAQYRLTSQYGDTASAKITGKARRIALSWISRLFKQLKKLI